MWLRWIVHNLLSDAVEGKVRQAVDQAKEVVEPAVRRRVAGANAVPARSADDPPETSSVVVLCADSLEAGGMVDLMSDVVTTRCASFVEHAGELAGERLVVCESGVGRKATTTATEDIVAIYQPKWLISAGFAAAPQPDLRRGHIVMASWLARRQMPKLEVSLGLDRSTSEGQPGLHVGPLLTIDHLVRDRAEKEQLADQSAALACDLETYYAAEICQQKQVRFLSIRIITDQMDDALPTEIEHMMQQGSFAGKLGAATRALWQRPRSVKEMWKMRESAITASDRLAKFLGGVVAQLEH